MQFGLKSLCVGFFALTGAIALCSRLEERTTLIRTERSLDLAIVGDGFFEVTDVSTGQAFYTRSARLSTNDDGLLSLMGSSHLVPNARSSGWKA